MIPQHDDDLAVLAGEYMLGLLDPAERQEIERALPGHPALRAAVEFWEERLHPLSALAAPAEPAPDSWDKIARRIRLSPHREAAPARRGAWHDVRVWRWSAAGFAAMAAALAIYIGVVAPSPALPGPSLVAVLAGTETKQAGWIATIGPHGLLIRNVDGRLAPKDRSYELWGIAPGAKRPAALGVIAADGTLELAGLAPAQMADTTLAISVEPVGGSPTGQATGPVVFVGVLKPS